MTNILNEQYYNLNNWIKNMPSFPVFENYYENGINTLQYQGGGGYERVYIPITVEKNHFYQFRFKFHSPSGFQIGTYGSNYTFAFIRKTEPVDADGALWNANLAYSQYLNTQASENDEQYTIDFFNTENSILYVVLDFGYVLDGVTSTYIFSDFELYDCSDSHMSGTYTVRAEEIKAQTADKYNSNSIWGGNYCEIQGSNSWVYRTFLQYDISIIPPNAIINSAKLKGYCRSWNDNTSTGTTNIARITSDWNYKTMTWNNQPATTGAYLTTNVSPPTVGTWTDWDITNLVKEWHEGIYPNYGLHIKNNNEGSYRVNWGMSCAKEGIDKATYIEITYTMLEDYYLIQDDNTTYSLKTGELENLNTYSLSSNLFKNYGLLNQRPNWEQIKTLTNPKILVWRCKDGETINNFIKMTAYMKAITSPQILITNKIDLKDTNDITGIKKVTTENDGDILFAVSFDNKETWLIFNEAEWSITSTELEGMSKTTLEAITPEQWASALGESKIIYFKIIFSNVDDTLRKINIEFLKS